MAKTYIPGTLPGEWFEVTIDSATGQIITTSSAGPGYVPNPEDVSSTTFGQIVRAALRILDARSGNEEVTAQEMADAGEALNAMIDSWNIEPLMVYAQTATELPLTSGVQTYTLGPGGDWNVPRPLKIDKAVAKLSDGREYELDILTTEEWAAIQYKSQTLQFPCCLYSDNAFPTASVSVWPIPSDSLTVTLYAKTQFRKFSSPNDLLLLPPGYERALRYGLAVELAPEFAKGGEASPTVLEILRSAKANLKKHNAKPAMKMTCDEALINGSSWGLDSGLFVGFGGTSQVNVITTIPSGVVNGVNTMFTLPSTPASGLMVFKNGLKLLLGTAYTATANTITFMAGYIPQTGDTLEAIYNN